MPRLVRIALATFLCVLPAASLRWAAPVVDSLANGVPDLTTSLFLVPIVLGLAGLPGYVGGVASRLTLARIDRTHRWIIVGNLAELVSGVATIVLWIISSAPIMSTLTPLDWVEWLAAPASLALACVWVRR